MADTAGQQDLRNLKIDKVSRDMFEEALIFKKLLPTISTNAREVRWWQKTSGYLSAATTSGFTQNMIQIAPGAMPWVAEQSWTKNTSYCKMYKLDSPMIFTEDEMDNVVRVFMQNMEDVTAGVANKVDADIWDVISESQSPSNINDVTSTAAWDAASGQDPWEDILEAIQLIREGTKRPIKQGVLLVSAKGEKDLARWIVSDKGSSIVNFSSELIQDGVLARIGGLKVIVSENVTADYAMVADMSQGAEYQEFMPLRTEIITEPLIGRKVRVATGGITLLTRPEYFALISNTET